MSLSIRACGSPARALIRTDSPVSRRALSVAASHRASAPGCRSACLPYPAYIRPLNYGRDKDSRRAWYLHTVLLFSLQIIRHFESDPSCPAHPAWARFSNLMLLLMSRFIGNMANNGIFRYYVGIIVIARRPLINCILRDYLQNLANQLRGE